MIGIARKGKTSKAVIDLSTWNHAHYRSKERGDRNQETGSRHGTNDEYCTQELFSDKNCNNKK